MRLIDADALNDALIQKQYSAQSMGILYTEYPNMMGIVAKQPTIEAAPVNNNPCGFCGKFNFGDAKAEVYSHGANIVLASALARFPVEEQFNFCPVCGRPVKKGGTSND